MVPAAEVDPSGVPLAAPAKPVTDGGRRALRRGQDAAGSAGPRWCGCPERPPGRRAGSAAARKSTSPKMSGFLSTTRAPAVTGASEEMTIAAGSPRSASVRSTDATPAGGHVDDVGALRGERALGRDDRQRHDRRLAGATRSSRTVGRRGPARTPGTPGTTWLVSGGCCRGEPVGAQRVEPEDVGLGDRGREPTHPHLHVHRQHLLTRGHLVEPHLDAGARLDLDAARTRARPRARRDRAA